MLLLCSLLSGILQCAHEAVKEIEYLSNGSWSAVGKEKECSKTTDLSSLSHSKTCIILKLQFVMCKSVSRPVINTTFHFCIILACNLYVFFTAQFFFPSDTPDSREL